MARDYLDSSFDEKRKLSEENEVRLWHERIRLSRKARDQWIQESGAERFINEYKGKFDIFFQARLKKIPIPPINEVFAYVQSDIASMYNRDPYLTVNPKAGTVLGAKLREVWLNYIWRELKIKEEIELEMIDKDLVGRAWNKTGYSVQSIGTGDKLKIEDEKFYSLRLDWKDIFWNLESKRPPKDCLWMAQKITRPLRDIKKKYPKAKKMEGQKLDSIDDETYKKAAYKDDIKFGVIYEIWDAEEKKIRLIGEGIEDRYLEDPKPWPEYQDEFPFLDYWDFWVPDSAYPMSAIAPWEAQILEEMILLAQAMNHAKRWNRQLFVRNGSIDDNALDKFERGDDGAVIPVNGQMEDGSFKFADFGPLPTDFYLLMDRLQAIKRNINGQPEFVRGGVTKTNTRTIGELQLMQAGTRSREDRKIDRLETHLENIARHLIAHFDANFDLEETSKVVGDTPEEVIKALGDKFDPVTRTVKFTPEDIKGEYDVEVKAGSTLPMDKMTRMKVFEIILTTVAQVTSRGPMSPFMNALIQNILSDYEVKGLEEAYQEEVVQVKEMMARQVQEGDVEKEKTEMEAAKREAQARQIATETQILQQEAELEPFDRSQLKRLEKEPIIPRTNGSGR